MRTVEYRATHVPAFLTKLWKLVTDRNSDDLISWSVGGTSFIIYDEIRFAKELLPMYFKHNNMASFVRQLNMYGFRKLSCVDQGGMHSMKHEIEFYHQYFIKDQETLLELIKRKIPTTRTSEDSKVKPEYVKELISSIKYLQGKQQSSDEGMRNLRKENKLLWRQLSVLNNCYVKQQSMLQQVLPLFMNMMQPNHRLPLKRRQPLMLHDGESVAKLARLETPYYVEHVEQDVKRSETDNRITHSAGRMNSNHGPVIHEVTEGENSKTATFAEVCLPNKEHDVIVDSPLSSLGSSEHTMDVPNYAEHVAASPETMKPSSFSGLNCSFQSLNGMTPPAEMMAGQPMTIPIMHPNVGLPPMGNHLRDLSSIPASRQMQQNSPVAVPLSPESLVASPAYSSPMEAPVMDILNAVSNQGPVPSTSGLAHQEPAIQNPLSWIPLGPDSELNLESWLGQIFSADNLMAGASLP